MGFTPGSDDDLVRRQSFRLRRNIQCINRMFLISVTELRVEYRVLYKVEAVQ